MAFDNILGHERVRDLLAQALASRRVPPALLLTGPEGVGKRTLAIEVARALLCERVGAEPCESCSACRGVRRAADSLLQMREEAAGADDPERFNHRLHPDCLLVEPSPASIKIEQVRAIVRELAARPFQGASRAVIVDNAHLMTEQGMNTLLKSLEEPPEGTHFFLVTSSPETLLPTIKSRCQTLRLGPIPDEVIEEYLVRDGQRKPDEAHLIATISGGSMGFALAFDSGAYRGLRDEMLKLLEGSGALERLERAQALSESGELALALTALRSLLRDLVALRAGAAAEAMLNRDAAPRLSALARGSIGDRAAALAEKVGEVRWALDRNTNRLLVLDILMDAVGG